MIRLTLRQFRTEGVIGVVVLVACAIVLVVTGVHLVHVRDAFEQACTTAQDCATAQNPLVNAESWLQNAVKFIAIIAPALIGLFFGAPLIARELETGTFRLAWTQSVTRRRWLAVKLGMVGLAAMAFGGLLTWMTNWWASPIDAVQQNRFNPTQFSYHGVAPLGYAAFAFALGATTGVLFRRTVPAMAATLAGFAAARLVVTVWVRPNFASAAHESLRFPAPEALGKGFGFAPGSGGITLAPPPAYIPNAWVYSTELLDKAGRALTSQYLFRACPFLTQNPAPTPGPGGKNTATNLGPEANLTCIHRLAAAFHTFVTYQPASRFWPFQWAEMGVFLAAGIALCGLTYWWLRRQYA